MAITDADPKARPKKAKFTGTKLTTPTTRGVDHLRVTHGIVWQGRLGHGNAVQPAAGGVQHVVGRLHLGQVVRRRPRRAAEVAGVSGRGELHGVWSWIIPTPSACVQRKRRSSGPSP